MKKKEKVVFQADPVQNIVPETKVEISPIVETFGNGDVNVLRDKINEIIKCLNK